MESIEIRMRRPYTRFAVRWSWNPLPSRPDFRASPRSGLWGKHVRPLTHVQMYGTVGKNGTCTWNLLLKKHAKLPSGLGFKDTFRTPRGLPRLSLNDKHTVSSPSVSSVGGKLWTKSFVVEETQLRIRKRYDHECLAICMPYLQSIMNIDLSVPWTLCVYISGPLLRPVVNISALLGWATKQRHCLTASKASDNAKALFALQIHVMRVCLRYKRN